MGLEILFFISIALFVFTVAITARVFLGSNSYSARIKQLMVVLSSFVFAIFVIFSIIYIDTAINTKTVIVNDTSGDYMSQIADPVESEIDLEHEVYDEDEDDPESTYATDPPAMTPASTPSPILIGDDKDSQQTSQGNTVFYTPNGEVYHKTADCSSLSRSKTILSATIEDAILEGKENPCKICY